MEQERSIDRLARLIIGTAIFTIIALLCWYFRSVLVYIIAAFVVSLIGQPVVRALRKVRIKGRTAPDWLLAILTLVIIFLGLILVVTQIIPVVSGIIRIIRGVQLRKLQKALQTQAIGSRWWLVLLTGILLVAFGVLSFSDPSGLMVAIGINFGINIIVSGVGLVAVAA